MLPVASVVTFRRKIETVGSEEDSVCCPSEKLKPVGVIVGNVVFGASADVNVKNPDMESDVV
jgi:hypothetical protein